MDTIYCGERGSPAHQLTDVIIGLQARLGLPGYTNSPALSVWSTPLQHLSPARSQLWSVFFSSLILLSNLSAKAISVRQIFCEIFFTTLLASPVTHHYEPFLEWQRQLPTTAVPSVVKSFISSCCGTIAGMERWDHNTCFLLAETNSRALYKSEEEKT